MLHFPFLPCVLSQTNSPRPTGDQPPFCHPTASPWHRRPASQPTWSKKSLILTKEEASWNTLSSERDTARINSAGFLPKTFSTQNSQGSFTPVTGLKVDQEGMSHMECASWGVFLLLTQIYLVFLILSWLGYSVCWLSKHSLIFGIWFLPYVVDFSTLISINSSTCICLQGHHMT